MVDVWKRFNVSWDDRTVGWRFGQVRIRDVFGGRPWVSIDLPCWYRKPDLLSEIKAQSAFLFSPQIFTFYFSFMKNEVRTGEGREHSYEDRLPAVA